MAAEECVPFIPEISNDLENEKINRYQDNNYSRVDLEDYSSSSQNSGHIGLHARLTAHKKNIALGFLTLLALGIFVTVSVQAIRTSSKKPVPPGRIPGLEYTSDGRLLSCGNTFEEAKAAGCKFDIMTFVWTPPACYDEEAALDAVDENSELAPSRAAGPWHWWRFENHTEPLPQNIETLSSVIPVWIDNSYHRAHCLYTWRVSQRAMTQVASPPPGGVWVWEKIVDWAHLSHCTRLLNHMEEPENPAHAVARIGACVRVDDPSKAAAGGKGLFAW